MAFNRLFVTRNKNSKPQPKQSSWSTTASRWFDRTFNFTSIRNKIFVGYIFAIIVSGIGVIAARVAEEYANEVVEEQAETVQERAEMLNDFNLILLEIHDLHYRLIAALDRPEELLKKIHKLTEARAIFAKLYDDIQEWINEDDTGLADEALETEQIQISQWIIESKTTIQDYINQLLEYSRQLETNATNIDRFEATRNELIAFSQSKNSIVFGDRIEELTEINRDYIEAKANAIHEAYKEVEELEGVLLFVSAIVATCITAFIAILMSAAISHPLEETTEIAKRAISESNFNLKAPVLTQDEVGQLTMSLNQLMQHVATMLAEIQRAQAQLVQNEKMSSLGKLVAGIAHEINNPLTFIEGNLFYSQEYAEDLLQLTALYGKTYPNSTPEIQAELNRVDLEYIEKDWPKLFASMKYGTVRIEKIVNVLRVFSRLNESTVKEIDIHESIDSTLAILESQARVNLPHFKFEVIKNYNRLPKINCYAGQLNQVFVNLLENSIDSFQDLPKSIQPQISIVTEAIDDCIRVKISDNGSGIPPEIQDKIFDPFFTTKPVGQGTGLGLSTCYDIVRKHQGWIEVSSSTVDRGTEFIITLPVRPTFSPIASVVKSL